MSETLGIIAPHPPILLEAVGGARSEATAQSVAALSEARDALRRFGPDALVLSSPHAPMLPDAFVVRTAADLHADFSEFGAPAADWAGRGDPALATAIRGLCDVGGVPVVPAEDLTQSTTVDHGLAVPLWFLDPDGDIPVVEVSLSHLSFEAHERFGRAIADAAREAGRRVAFVASGDLSHRLTPGAPAGYHPHAQEFDDSLVSLVRANDLAALKELDPSLVAAAGECGLRSFIILAGFLAGTRHTARVLHYEAPWGVGYLTALVGDANDRDGDGASGSKGGQPGSDDSVHVALARRAITEFLRSGATITPPDEPVLAAPSAAFVSLHRGGELRGCIGTTEPTRPTLGEEIVEMAIHAATQDPRFPTLMESELDDLDISVDVLMPPQPASGPEDLDAQTYGVIVQRDWRRGLLLPCLEGVDTPEEQIAIAKRKAGITADQSVTLERFRVERFH